LRHQSSSRAAVTKRARKNGGIDYAPGKNAWANIPSRSNRKQRFAFSGWLYRQRNLVERFFNRIKHFRGIATRYDKCPENYLAAVKLICARIWCASCGGGLGRSGA
jgi:transposase